MRKILLKEQKIVHPNHRYNYRKSHLGVVSGHWDCQRCGHSTPNLSKDYIGYVGECVTWKREYLEPPVFSEEFKAHSSMDQIEKAIKKTMLQMKRFVKKHQDKPLPSYYIHGTTSIASQAYSRLMVSGELIVRGGKVKLNT